MFLLRLVLALNVRCAKCLKRMDAVSGQAQLRGNIEGVSFRICAWKWPASSMPPWMAVIRITQEQLSKLSALTHMDVGNVENVRNSFLPDHASNFV